MLFLKSKNYELCKNNGLPIEEEEIDADSVKKKLINVLKPEIDSGLHTEDKEAY